MSALDPGHDVPRALKVVQVAKRVVMALGVTDLPYELWYIDQFPLARLKYTPLEDVEGETKRRLALTQDIAERGLLNPLIVWNHTPSGHRPSPRPYYLHFGYNKLWALKRLERTHARAFLTLDRGVAPEFPCMGCPSPRTMIGHFVDGTLVLGFNGPVFKDVTSISNWEVPANTVTQVHPRAVKVYS